MTAAQVGAVGTVGLAKLNRQTVGTVGTVGQSRAAGSWAAGIHHPRGMKHNVCNESTQKDVGE